MSTIAERLQKKISEALLQAYGEELSNNQDLLEPELTPATQDKFGHYQCNHALKLAKVLKQRPRDIAQNIINYLPENAVFSKVEVAEPGFINLTLCPEFLEKEIKSLLEDTHLGVSVVPEKKRVIVEFSSPNIAKELHVGHLRSTIIGDSLARLFEFLGYDVLRLNHIGDWGTQFGMLIAYLKEFERPFLEGKCSAELSQLMHWYKESKKKFDADRNFKKQAQLEVVRLQGGDETSLEIWEMICDISRRAFSEIYQLLDIKLEERGESFYSPYLPEVINDLEKKELVTISDGAKCVFLEGYTTRDGSPLPVIIQKSDGGYNYDTTDLAAMLHRIKSEFADRIIIVTDAGQSLHFEMLEKIAEKAGYFRFRNVQFDHVPFGVVLGSDGKKFKTRSGETEKLMDLILEAVHRAETIFKERLPNESEETIKKYAEILGVNAIKYADLSSHRVKDYVFSYDRMLRFEGNTAAFLLYAFVRIQGIKRKINKKVPSLLTQIPIQLTKEAEILLALHLRRFSEVLQVMSRDLLPNRLCEYLYELAEKFHAFYRDCPVEGSEYEDSRFLLCEACSRILEKGLHILGLKTLPKM